MMEGCIVVFDEQDFVVHVSNAVVVLQRFAVRSASILLSLSFVCACLGYFDGVYGSKIDLLGLGMVHSGLFLVGIGNILLNYVSITSIDSLYAVNMTSICCMGISVAGAMLVLAQLVLLLVYIASYSAKYLSADAVPTLGLNILECSIYFSLFYRMKLLTTETYQKIKNGNQIPQIRMNSNNRRGEKEYQYGAVSTSTNTTKVKLRRSSFGGQTSGYVIGARVLSQYGTATASNTLWYHGKISSLHRDGSYDIVYDNGDIEFKKPRSRVELLSNMYDKNSATSRTAVTDWYNYPGNNLIFYGWKLGFIVHMGLLLMLTVLTIDTTIITHVRTITISLYSLFAFLLACKVVRTMISCIGAPVYTTSTHTPADEMVVINPCFEDCVCYIEAIVHCSSSCGHDHDEMSPTGTEQEDLFAL